MEFEVNLSALNPTGRFSSRADNYAEFRPSYPLEIIAYLEKRGILKHDSEIADIGSGTGIFSELLLKHTHKVICIEPNEKMREKALKQLADYEFVQLPVTAEETGLPGSSIDLITVAQAFHWMHPVRTKKEFNRILKPAGHIALIWNIRLTTTPFLKAFENLKLIYGTDYQASRMVDEETLNNFFHPSGYHKEVYYHYQLLPYEALEGQLLSTSYVPIEGKEFKEMIDALKKLFDLYQENGMVKIEYNAYLYVN